MKIDNLSDNLIEKLTKQFALQATDNAQGNTLSFKKGEGDIIVVEVRNQHASAKIGLQGAHILSWIPQGEEEVIWVSKDAKFAKGKSVRGGVPICWPWFGAHGTEDSFPAHGFARTVDWQVIKTEALDDGTTNIRFTTQALDENKSMWPADTQVEYRLNIGKKLEMELVTHNNGTAPITIGQALHTYFNVGDVSNVLLHGLDDTVYLDKLEDFASKHQHGHVTIDKEVDRVYLNTSNDCVIEDKTLKRNIVIIKCGSNSTVVWNPWQKTANKMGDLGEDGYKKMLCVESCNAADDVVTIEAGKAHHLWVQYEVQKL